MGSKKVSFTSKAMEILNQSQNSGKPIRSRSRSRYLAVLFAFVPSDFMVERAWVLCI